MNVENERIEREVEAARESEIEEVSVEEVRRALQKMKRGKAVGPDDIPAEAWKCLGAIGTDVLTDMFNKIIETEKMPDEWRKSTLVPIFKNKGDIQECENYRGIKLVSHTLKIWERVIESMLREMMKHLSRTIWFHAREEHHRCYFCIEAGCREVQRGTTERALCFQLIWRKHTTEYQEQRSGTVCLRLKGVVEG